MPQGLPTGTGECCAPKLLHYAATQGFKPLAMAEFWWGSGSKEQGKFYGACAERCEPIMGFLLSGLSKFDDFSKISEYSLPIIYEDEWLVAVDKPSGLLSVPGRHSGKGDSVWSRLRNSLADGVNLRPVHRLDKDFCYLLVIWRAIVPLVGSLNSDKFIRSMMRCWQAGLFSPQEPLIYRFGESRLGDPIRWWIGNGESLVLLNFG